MKSYLLFFLQRCEFIGEELGLGELGGPHKLLEGALLACGPQAAPSGGSSLHNSLYIPKIIHKKFRPILGTFISGQK